MTASQIKYIMAIDKIIEFKGYARAIDISQKLNVSKPSVSKAINSLILKRVVYLSHDRDIQFTAYGKKQLDKYLRCILSAQDFLSKLLGYNCVKARSEAICALGALSENTVNLLFDRITEGGDICQLL